MKKSIFLTALISVVLWFNSINSYSQLTAEQKKTIKEEVGAQLDKHLEALRKLDYELWLEAYSKDHFVPGFLPGVIGTYPDYEGYVGAIKDSFARRVRQNYETMQVKITPLSPELAMLTYTGLFENWFKNEEYRQDYCNATLLWKMEAGTWKIIYINESWIPRDQYSVQ